MASKDKGESKSKPKKAGASKAKAEAAAPKKAVADLYRIPRESKWARAAQYAGVLALVGGVMSAVAWNSDSHRFAFSWLFAIMTVLAMALGSLFFVIVQHITQAAWSVAFRRMPET